MDMNKNINVRLTQEEKDFLDKQGNASQYIRILIHKEMEKEAKK